MAGHGGWGVVEDAVDEVADAVGGEALLAAVEDGHDEDVGIGAFVGGATYVTLSGSAVSPVLFYQFQTTRNESL